MGCDIARVVDLVDEINGGQGNRISQIGSSEIILLRVLNPVIVIKVSIDKCVEARKCDKR